MIEVEILNSIDFYGPFLGNIDMVQQWRLYKENGIYDQDIVDLCLHAVANCTGITVDVMQATGGGIRNVVIEPGKPGIPSRHIIHLTSSHDHYNPVVSAQTKNDFDCNPEFKKKFVIELPKSEKKPNEESVPDNCKYSSNIESFSPLSPSSRYAILDDSSDDCIIFEPRSEKGLNSSNFLASCSTSDEQFNLKYGQSDSSDEQNDSNDEQNQSNEEESETSDDLSNPIKVIGNRTYLNESIWEGLVEQHVEKLPLDINGTQIFKVKVPDDSNPMKATKDGKQWQRYVPSSRKGFTGTRRIANCSGTHQCISRHCSFLKEFGQPNTTQFLRNGQKRNCMHCNAKVRYSACSARKIWEVPKVGNSVTVYHYGYHNCTVKPVKKDVKHLEKLKDKFVETPKVTPTQMAFQSVIASIEGDGTWDEIEKVAEQFSDIHAIKNAKKSAAKQKRPHGHSFEAVSVLKKKTDLKDPFLIYKANDGSLNEQPSYVFKSSKLRANMAINMDRTGDHMLSKEYCHFDGKHDRCKNFVTLTARVYHPVLRRMVKLALMECNSENEENLILFWNLLNEVIRRESGNEYTFFDPCGFICDEAGANWASLKSVFGDDVLQRTKGCELHYLQSLHRHANTLNSRKSKHNLKKLGNNLREAATPAGFQAVYDSIVSFINAKHEKRKHLLHWLQWWVERKTHFSKAYRPLHNAPTTNLSEPVNSSFQRRGHSNISLVDAALEDVAESLLLEKIRFRQSHGEKVYGSGPTQPQLQQRENSNQVRRAEQVVKEIDTYSNTDTVVSRKDAQRTAIIDPQCSHRPTKSKKRKRNSSSCSKKAPGKKAPC